MLPSATQTAALPQRKAAGKSTEPVEHPLLVGCQQAVAPSERGMQCAVALIEGAAGALEEAEPVIQPREQSGKAEGGNTRGRKFKRERNAVEPPTNFGN